jgi:hypothetical protein
VKTAVVQMTSGSDLARNLARAGELIRPYFLSRHERVSARRASVVVEDAAPAAGCVNTTMDARVARP